jgi:hypothetical protein
MNLVSNALVSNGSNVSQNSDNDDKRSLTEEQCAIVENALTMLYNVVQGAGWSRAEKPEDRKALPELAEVLASCYNYTGGKGANPDLVDTLLIARVRGALRDYGRANRSAMLAGAKSAVEAACEKSRVETREEIAAWEETPEALRRSLVKRGFAAPSTTVQVSVSDLLPAFPFAAGLAAGDKSAHRKAVVQAITVLTGWGYSVAETEDPADKRSKLFHVVFSVDGAACGPVPAAK